MRDLWPVALQIEQRCGLFLRERWPPAAAAAAAAALEGLGSLSTLGEAGRLRGISIVETGLPTNSSASAFCRFTMALDSPLGTSIGIETLKDTSAGERRLARQHADEAGAEGECGRIVRGAGPAIEQAPSGTAGIGEPAVQGDGPVSYTHLTLPTTPYV